MHKDLSMDVRLDRIGELLAKAVHLYVKQEREKNQKNQNPLLIRRIGNIIGNNKD